MNRGVRSIILGAAVLCASVGFSQKDTKIPMDNPTYSTAIGLRAGTTSGVTFKHFFHGGTVHAFEGIIGIWPDAVGITGLYEKHVPMNLEVRGLSWYYGGGAHLTGGNNRNYYTYDDKRKRFLYQYSESRFSFGVDGIVGAEYKVPQIPFAFSLDMKPMIEINEIGDVNLMLDPSIGVKVAF